MPEIQVQCISNFAGSKKIVTLIIGGSSRFDFEKKFQWAQKGNRAMKITRQFARAFAEKWVQAWNIKDLEAIMTHYTENVVFSSPFILKAQINNQGTIYGKTELRKYFERALEHNPDLHFDLKHIMVGIKSITLIYTRKKTMLASEIMILNNEGKVVEGLSHYPVDEIYDL